MNESALRAEIARKGYTLPSLAKALGIGKKAIYEKVGGKTEFRQTEMKKLKGLLDLSTDKITEIFFAD